MHINSFKDGHDILRWKMDGSSVENEMALTSSSVTLDCFDNEGTYVFWTIGQDGQESRRMRVYILCDPPMKIIERILGYSNVEQKARWAVLIITRLKQEFSARPDIPLVDHLRKFMDETKDLQDYEKKFYYELIFIAERYHNALNIAMNSSLETFPVITYAGRFHLKTKKEVDQLRLYSVTKDGDLMHLPPVRKDPMDFSNTITASIKEAALCRIIPMAAGTNDWLNYFISYQFDEERTSELWKNAVTELDQLEQAIMDDTTLSMHNIELTVEDKKNWKLERAKEPYDFVMPRPVMEITDRASFCQVTIPEWELLKAANKQFYIVNKESDLLLRDDFDYQTPIHGSSVIIDRAGKYVDGNQFFYIQSEDGAVISRFTFHDFQDADKSESYRQKVRLLQFDLYEKRLRNMMRYYLPEAESYIADLLGRFRTIPSVDIDEIYKFLLCEITRSYEDQENADKLMFVILEDWNSNFNVEADFFKTAPKYYYATDNFVFPTSQDDYLLCVGEFDFTAKGEKPKMSYYHSSRYQAIQLQVRSLRYYFMYAIDLKTFHRSGFIYVDTYNHVDPIIYHSGISYERM